MCMHLLRMLIFLKTYIHTASYNPVHLQCPACMLVKAYRKELARKAAELHHREKVEKECIDTEKTLCLQFKRLNTLTVLLPSL